MVLQVVFDSHIKYNRQMCYHGNRKLKSKAHSPDMVGDYLVVTHTQEMYKEGWD
jgi:hypothetical protein